MGKALFTKRPRKGRGMVSDALQGSERSKAIKAAIAFLEPVLAVPAVVTTKIVGPWPDDEPEPEMPKPPRVKKKRTKAPKVVVDLTDWPME